jgi:hypothetical protein
MTESSTSPPRTHPETKLLFKKELPKYEYTPTYLYTEKDSLNRITILKETGKESYLVAGRYSGVNDQARLYMPLAEEERREVEKLLKMRSKDAAITFI